LEAFANKVGKVLSEQLASEEELASNLRGTYLNALKMYVYLVVEMMKLYQTQTKNSSLVLATPSKGKKGRAKSYTTGSGMSCC